MSKSTHPSEVMTSETPFAAMTGEMTEMQKEAIAMLASAPHFAGAANLAAHPMGAMAAASALGLGMASQMFGMFAGTMAGAMRAANMLANETTGDHSAVFGLANPLDFDLATGSFDDAKEPDTVAAKPVVAKTPAPKKPAVKKAEAPAKPATKKSAPKKAEAEVKKAEVKTAAKKPAPKPASKAKTAAVKAAPAKPEPVALATAAPEAAAGMIEPVMPEDFVKPKPMAKPDMPDDLKVISGVGPKLEGVLNSLGIWTYEQIAGWTPYEIAWIDDYLQFKGRIERDEWVSQAAELMKKG
jgi:NADH-quinone oxidoreductase subunit E